MSIAALCVLAFLGVYEQVQAQDGRGFNNPILAGFYPDPSVCKVGSDYYLVNSTFSYFPGLPVFRSRDLVNWKLIGHVLDRPEQLKLDGQGVSRGLFAPAIRYNNGTFYVTCTLVDIGGNFVVTSKTPEGPWSNPIWLPEINGIDPSLFFDDDGKVYILYNSIPPDEKPLYGGHRTIRMYEFDVESLRVTGTERMLVNGGTDISRKPVWIEGPHIFKKDGSYYLICAEGGTADQHSEVVFKSANVWGPYIPYDGNPILTQRHLSPQRENPITSTGHADFVQTETGNWWAVFLGCRPYVLQEGEYCNTGRETFLAPVKWKEGWPIINPDHEEVQYHYPYPIQPVAPTDRTYGGNLKVRDEFDQASLNHHWMFLRTPHERWYDLNTKPGFLSMKLRPESCSGKMNPSFLGHRQQHLTCSASVIVDFAPASENEKAGLLIFQNETHFYFLCKSRDGNEQAIQLYRSADNKSSDDHMELIASQHIRDLQKGNALGLRIEARRDVYSFSYAFRPNTWMLLKDSVDAKFLSTKVAGGFAGAVYAMYATSLGKPTAALAHFDRFEYVGNDEVYR
jgi:alpha-N-arabinofuranosidase